MRAKTSFDLGSLNWSLTGFMPTGWTGKSMELGFALEPEIAAVPASVPGSVQGALRAAGQLPDWYEGLNSLACEWVEHRDWMFSAKMPDAWFAGGSKFVLNCGGLDGHGVVVFNKKEVGRFDNAFVPYAFDLSPHVKPTGNELHIVFFVPPRWLGQIGYTSQMKEWKPRFNYSWDWIPRIVQIGPWEPVVLEVSEGARIAELRCRADWDVAKNVGGLWVGGGVDLPAGAAAARVRLTLRDGQKEVKRAELAAGDLARGVTWAGLAVEPWRPNGEGERTLYTLDCELLDRAGARLDQQQRTVGFKHVEWRSCANAPAGADPWVCVVNGKPIFLQGINWTPIRATFADLKREDYAALIEQYQAMGCNTFRVWGGGVLEKEWFYDLCDRHGILVWQEFAIEFSRPRELAA